jgi:23S rRNA (cytidine1920-2'-O)/16S rRNA (cytidine1409-2'-O)-methyltransferase
MPKVRLDVLLVERGLAESRAQAQRLVMAGQVRVEGQVALKPAASVANDAILEVVQPPAYVSRGGEKLAAALQAFDVPVEGRVCADVGASTGGFTDCLLQHGARRVYAIDVGKGVLHWKLRQDPRVVVMEATNARFVETLPEPVDLVTIDASFISLKVLLPVVKRWFRIVKENNQKLFSEKTESGDEAGQLIALIKPQFEAGRQAVAHGAGVIRDPAVHRQVLQDVLGFARQEGYGLQGLIRSPLLGPKGNTEFLAWLGYPLRESIPMDLDSLLTV